jgi:PIN domain nuclease of toxin-antitoxin system
VTDRGPSLLDSRLPLVLDTHVLIWLVFGGPMLGKRATEAIRQASSEDSVLLSAITPLEIGVLVSKNRIGLRQDALDWMRSALTLPGFCLIPMGPEIAIASTRVPWEMHPDPVDRILAATVRHLGAVLVTADRKLLEHADAKHFHALNARA